MDFAYIALCAVLFAAVVGLTHVCAALQRRDRK